MTAPFAYRVSFQEETYHTPAGKPRPQAGAALTLILGIPKVSVKIITI